MDLAYSPFLSFSARIADGLNLFKLIVDHESPISSQKLASISKGEELLIGRILRALASIGSVDEVGPQKWQPTAITRAMAKEEIAAGHRTCGNTIVEAGQKASKYFSEAGYRCPTDPRDSLMQYAFQTKLTTFEYMSSIPRVLKDFNTFMGNTMGARKYWTDWYPVKERLLDGSNETSPFLVDVGGGKGHDVLEFQAKYPQKGRRLVLQDLSPVTSDLADLGPGIERMTYDFFTEQPVQGARAYFYHHILHDWPDSYCLKILEQVRKSMTLGYSKLIIHELVLPEQNADKTSAVFDLAMMAFNAGMERTGTQWRELLGQAGFQNVRVWTAPEVGADGVIEAMIEE
ncbi:hypothetical protein INS49_012229 [Diaporthe citri]|uniref:uncharacterized protein n=1 Tax=Diaporthe citri TaxID=83186 RepID=UPI001C81AECC|nr:uncharacterized protein INS49_012229 [Diaporthe citri]KAG6358711.1 hypothetical protein INS49_012229 [Diaporthe citri]